MENAENTSSVENTNLDIPFFKPFFDKSESEFIARALNGEKSTAIFETKVASYYGAKHAIATNNGTAAKHLALCAMDIKRGDKIICPVNSFVSLPEVIRYFGAEPIFADIDKDDFCLDPAALESVIKANKSKKLKAVFLTHLGGQSAKVDIIKQICKKYELKIIHDSAFGVRYNGALVGGGDEFMGCFGFQHSGLNQIASSGIILTNDDKIAARAKLFRSHAMEQKRLDDGSLAYIYDVKHIGQRYDLDALSAAFCLAQFCKNEINIKAHQHIARLYDEKLANVAHISTPVKKRDHIYAQYIIKIDKNRDGFAKELLAQGIGVGLHYVPLHLLSYYRKKYNYRITDFPAALWAYSQVLSLPIYPALSEAEIEHICKVITRIASARV
nr:DegT/DnrJ/EryC1/StrS family aminotransferase [uncultured Campylobacter sp.]